MKLHIVFELDTAPDVRLIDVSALTQLAAVSFVKACVPLGACTLHRIRGADVKTRVDMLAAAVRKGAAEGQTLEEAIRTVLTSAED